jgi:hypothetical protein
MLKQKLHHKLLTTVSYSADLCFLLARCYCLQYVVHLLIATTFPCFAKHDDTDSCTHTTSAHILLVLVRFVQLWVCIMVSFDVTNWLNAVRISKLPDARYIKPTVYRCISNIVCRAKSLLIHLTSEKPLTKTQAKLKKNKPYLWDMQVKTDLTAWGNYADIEVLRYGAPSLQRSHTQVYLYRRNASAIAHFPPFAWLLMGVGAYCLCECFRFQPQQPQPHQVILCLKLSLLFVKPLSCMLLAYVIQQFEFRTATTNSDIHITKRKNVFRTKVTVHVHRTWSKRVLTKHIICCMELVFVLTPSLRWLSPYLLAILLMIGGIEVTCAYYVCS